MLGGLFVCSKWVPLAPVDQVKRHSVLLLYKRLLLSVRLENHEKHTKLHTTPFIVPSQLISLVA